MALVHFFAWLAHAVCAPELLGGFAAGLVLVVVATTLLALFGLKALYRWIPGGRIG